MEITTKNGFTFQVDQEDEELARENGWWGMVHKKLRVNGEPALSRVYIKRRVLLNGKRTTQYLHRYLLNAPSGILCDHINGDTLDNRRSNLRLVTAWQSNLNRQKSIANKSGYKGVFLHKPTMKWEASIGMNERTIHIGLFKTKEEAALAYNDAAIKYFGEFARLNVL
jgi:hypothetical protein